MSSVNLLHRRKSSRENDGQLVVTITEPTTPQTDDVETHHQSQPSPRKLTTSAPEPPNGIPFPSPPRQRVVSTPSHFHPPPLYTTTHRSSFSSATAPGPVSPTSHRSHSRAPSTSSFYNPGPSPLSTTFPLPNSDSNPANPALVAHRPAPPPPKRHSRIHSRNLSVYFPRPGAGPPSIAEDGIQEVESNTPSTLVPDTLLDDGDMPFQQGRELSSSFTFGGKNPPNGGNMNETRTGAPPRAPRRGHHHKHSLSHNFFSFMEPDSYNLTSGAPTPVPVSASLSTTSSVPPWTRSPSPQSAIESKSIPSLQHHDSLISSGSAIALIQFLLGAFLWMRAQEVGSLSCTGLGYWVVFDAFGIALVKVLPPWFNSKSGPTYGAARIQTLAMFAQSIYLIFASVYVCKEAVEHALLSHNQGQGHGHHHHRGDDLDDDYGISFPVLLIFAALSALLGSSVKFDNNANIVDATCNRLPSLSSLFEPDQHISNSESTTPLGRAFSNPYTVLPLVMGTCILGIWALGNTSYHRQADLLLAFVMAVITFWASYPAAVALGKILLQTAPERSKKGKGVVQGDGRLEGFLRVMREFERHPQILHLPPPHIWQLTPSTISVGSSDPLPTLIVTLELHISQDLDDESTLRLTKWAWDRCMGVLGGAGEVTVGIVRG